MTTTTTTTTTITIHGFAPSTYVRTARMACLEKGLPHTLAPLEFRGPSHVALHPLARMPILTAGEVRIWETLAIVAWLDAHEQAGAGAPELLPSGSLERARTLQWISAACDYLYTDLVHELGGEDERPGLRDHLRTVLEMLNEPLEDAARVYFGGEQPSAADLFVFPMLAHAQSKPIEDSPWAGLAGLESWSHRMHDRHSAIASAS